MGRLSHNQLVIKGFLLTWVTRQSLVSRMKDSDLPGTLMVPGKCIKGPECVYLSAFICVHRAKRAVNFLLYATKFKFTRCS